MHVYIYVIYMNVYIFIYIEFATQDIEYPYCYLRLDDSKPLIVKK